MCSQYAIAITYYYNQIVGKNHILKYAEYWFQQLEQHCKHVS